MDAATLSSGLSVTQIPLISILLGFLGAWMITFLILALHSPAQHPADSQQERVHTALRSQVTASKGEAAQGATSAEEVTQIVG